MALSNPMEDQSQPRMRQFKVEYVPADQAPVLREEDAFVTKQYPQGYFEAPVLNWKRDLCGTFTIPASIFGEVLRSDIIHRCLVSRILERRAQDGVKATKTVTNMSGSGKKPRPQKGSGRARMGKKRAAQCRGGEKVHGRRDRDVSFGG